MIRIEINLENIRKQIEAAELAFTAVENALGKEGFESNVWPKLREKIKDFLIRNLDEKYFADVPISSRWIECKKDLIKSPISEYRKILIKHGFAGFTTQRFRGGGDLKVESSANWKATGTMEDIIRERLGSDQGIIRGSADVFSAELDVPVTDLVDQYPLIVDEKIQDRSSKRKGIVRLFGNQANEIFEMLIRENENLSAELFGEK